MRMNSGLGLYGVFSMTVYDHSTGKPTVMYKLTKKNKITNEGRQNLLHLFAQPTYDVDAKRLGQLIVGTNPAPASINDTIATPVIAWASDAFVYGSGGNITVQDALYTIDITVVCPTGVAIDGLTEAGILTADGLTLYARQTYNPIDKGTEMSITYNWQLGMMLQAE